MMPPTIERQASCRGSLREVICIAFVFLAIKSGFADECSESVNIGNENKRSPLNILENDALCDNTLNPNIWYKINSSIGYRLWDSCTAINHCGTYAPIWLNGPNPTDNDAGPVNRTVCAQYWPGGDCCGWSGQVTIKWCRDNSTQKEFYAYRLPPTPTCNMAYCVSTDYVTSTVPSTTTTTSRATSTTTFPIRTSTSSTTRTSSSISSTTSSTTTFPPPPTTTDAFDTSFPSVGNVFLSDPYVSEWMTIKILDGSLFNATKFSLKCSFNVNITLISAGYQIVFLADGDISRPLDIQTTNLTQPYGILTEEKLIGNLGKSITCRVSSFWDSDPGNFSTPRNSIAVWIGVHPKNETNETAVNIRLKEGEQFRFRMEASFVLTSRQCFNKSDCLPSDNIPFLIDIMRTPNQLTTDPCKFYLKPPNYSSQWITISPIPTTGTKKENFRWTIPFANVTGNDSLFYGYKIQDITVILDDTVPAPMCRIKSGLTIETFATPETNDSGRSFTIDTRGDNKTQFFNFVNATNRVFQIQLMQQKCDNAPAFSHICGVMVKENNNIIGINACWRRNQTNVTDNTPFLIRRLRDDVAPSGVIVSRSPISWTITMNSGVQINVDSQFNSCFTGAQFDTNVLTVYVIGLANDKYQGLCSYRGVQENCSTDCEIYKIPLMESFFSNVTNVNDNCQTFINTPPACSCSNVTTNELTCSLVDQSKLMSTQLKCGNEPAMTGKRRKRQIDNNKSPSNDTIFDLRFLFGDSGGSFVFLSSPVAVWPTPKNNITEQEAYQACSNALTNSKIYHLCQNLSYINFGKIIDGCVFDIQTGDDLSYAKAVPTILERLCVYAIEISIVDTRDANWTSADYTQDPYAELLATVLSLICPSQCSGNGNCSNGTCICNQGFIGDDCATGSNQTPNISYVLNYLCDVQQTICRNVYLIAKDVVNGNALQCSVTNLYTRVEYDSIATNSGAVVICSADFDIGIYNVSLTNNGRTFDKGVIFKVYNSSYPITPLPTTSRTTKVRFQG